MANEELSKGEQTNEPNELVAAINNSLGIEKEEKKDPEEEKKDPTEVVEEKKEPVKEKEEKKDSVDEVKDDNAENLSKFLDKEDPVAFEPKKVISEVKEGKDFEISNDGRVRIYAQHIVDDIDLIKTDLHVFSKIFKSAKGGDKAEVIAKSFGFKKELTRSAGTVANDVLSAYIDAVKSGDEEEAARISDGYIPDALKIADSDNYTFVGKAAEKDKGDEVSKSDSVNVPNKFFPKEEILSSVDSYIDTQIHKHVDSSSSPEDVEKARDGIKNEVLNSSKFFEELNKYKFDPATGEKMETRKAFSLAANAVFKETVLPKNATAAIGGGINKSETSDPEGNKVNTLVGAIKKSRSN